MTDRTVRIFRSFKEAEEADREFYRNLTPAERLKIWFKLCRFDKLDLPKNRIKKVCSVRPLTET